MQTSHQFLLTLGGVLLLGLLTHTLGHRTFLPRVTLLLIFGAVIGEELLDIIPVVFADRFEIIADIALVMVGFLLGGKLTKGSLINSASKVLWISISAAVITTFIVSMGLILFGVTTEIAILLGCIASATAPAAILDITIESDYSSPFKDLLLSIVALDDVWALVLFGFGIAIVTSMGQPTNDTSAIITALIEITGAVLLGITVGLPAAYLTGRIKPGQPILTEALGLVFICGGLALWMNVSYLIASMIMGSVVANFAKHHEYPFHAIEGIEGPFMVIFFVLAGASLDFSSLQQIGLIGIVYIVSRAVGKVVGARLGCQISRTDTLTRNWMGIALLPQAGVAIGMGLVASHHFPEYRHVLLPIVISSTIFFEIIGPIFTRLGLQRADTKT